MHVAVVILLAVVLLTPAVTLGVRYWQYRNWPPFLWKGRVSHWAEALRLQRDQLRRDDRPTDDLAALFDDHFERHLKSIPLEALDEYPGIGPATVARLLDAGLRTIGAVTRTRFESISGIGPTRATALRDAVKALVRQARSRFEAGTCPEAQEYRLRADALRAEHQRRHEERERKLAAVEAARQAVEPLWDIARRITFWTYLFHRDAPGVSEEVMNRPLPTVVIAPPPALPVATVVAVPPPVTITGPVAAAKPAPPGAVAPPPTVAPPPVAVVPPPAPITPSAPPPTASPASGAHPWLPRMRAFARFAFVMAKSDGRVAQSERAVIRAFLAAQFGHHDALARHIDPLMEQTEAAIPTEAEALAEARAVTTLLERQELYRVAEQIADAAGDRKPRERDALERIATALGITIASPTAPTVSVPAPPTPVAPVVAAPAPPPDPRTALEIPPGTELNPELIRRKYSLLAGKVDPTKARDMGPEFARLAEEKVARLRAAAETLIAPFGEPLEKPAAPPPPADPRHNPDLDDFFGG